MQPATTAYGDWHGLQQAVGGHTTATEAVLDLDQLRRFTLGDWMLEQEVLQLFAVHAPLTIAQLRAATTEKAWREAAHTLTGSAGAVGAARVARAAADAEQLSGQPGRWSMAVAQLEAALVATLAAIAGATAAPDSAGAA